MEFIEHNALGDQLPLDEETDGRRWDCGPATFGPDCAQNAQRELLPRTLTKRRVATITASAGKRPCPLRTSCGGAGIFRHRAQDGRGAFFAKHPPPPPPAGVLARNGFLPYDFFVHSLVTCSLYRLWRDTHTVSHQLSTSGPLQRFPCLPPWLVPKR